ncbi:MAG: ADP-ribosylation factor-like protein [Candidatus Hodarchaeales archaeon]|jgi:small GTP-binding protein
MSYSLQKKTTDKVLVLGLAESGKTTIIKVVTEGYTPDKKAPYTATLNYERKKITMLGKSVEIFDLGGQVAFLDRFTGELAEFIFSDVKSLIFVLDTVNVSELSRAKYYLDLAAKQIDKHSPTAPTHLLLHKTDLINPNKLDEITMSMKSYLTTGLKRPIAFYTTTVFSDSIFNAFAQILGEVTGTRETTGTKVEKFIKDNPGVGMVQLFSDRGVPLVGTSSDFYNVSLDQIRKIVENALQLLANSKESTTGAFLESEDSVYTIRFLANGMVLILGFSRKLLKENDESLSSMYDKTLALEKSLY